MDTLSFFSIERFDPGINFIPEFSEYVTKINRQNYAVCKEN